jgi:polyisoprenoid-binding protein YceI
MKKSSALIFTSLLLLATAAQAAPETYTYDPLHTQVLFSVNHMGFTNSHGRFNTFKGGFTLDEQNPETSTADITIDTKSLDMADNTWNEHVREKFLETEKFPTIEFKSTKITRTGDKTATLAGDLTLHGVTKPITLDVTLNNVGTNPMMATQKDAGFTITGSLKRSDFGMAAFIPMVGDEIALTIEVDGKHEDFSKTNK